MPWRRRGIPVVVVIVLVSVTTACRSPRAASPTPRPGVTTTSPTVPITATTRPAADPETASLGGTIVLRAVSLTGLITSLSLTLTQVVDAAQPSPGPETGDRFVHLLFAVTNEGSASFTDQQPPYYPPLMVAVDNLGYPAVAGAQPWPYGGYSVVATDQPGSSGSCTPTLTIAARATATECFAFELPVGVPVVIASVALDLGDSPDGTLGEWLMPTAVTTAPRITSDLPSGFALLGGTLSLRTAGPPTTGPDSPLLDVTLDQVIDPAPAPRSTMSPVSSEDRLTGDRWVALRFTLANVASVTVPCAEDQEDELSLGWTIDPDAAGGGGSSAPGLPATFCPDGASSPGLAPGATKTGEISFALPRGVPVVRVTAGLAVAGFGSGPGADWQLP